MGTPVPQAPLPARAAPTMAAPLTPPRDWLQVLPRCLGGSRRGTLPTPCTMETLCNGGAAHILPVLRTEQGKSTPRLGSALSGRHGACEMRARASPVPRGDPSPPFLSLHAVSPPSSVPLAGGPHRGLGGVPGGLAARALTFLRVASRLGAQHPPGSQLRL